MIKPKVGQVWSRNGQEAVIRVLYDDIPGGVILDRVIDGFRCWNVEDLTFVSDKVESV